MKSTNVTVSDILSALGTESPSFLESTVYFISVTAHTVSQAPSMKLTMTTAQSHTPVMMVSTDVSGRKLGLVRGAVHAGKPRVLHS